MSVVKNLFSGPKVPTLPTPMIAANTPAPTVDDARQAAETQLDQNRRRGALANILSPTDTGTALAQPTPETGLRRLLGG